MALGVLNGRFQFQRATKEEWEDSNIVLLDGELALESDTTRIKAGDGKTPYVELPYITIGSVGFDELTEEEKAFLVGPKGEPFTYDDFTQKQLNQLKGEDGKDGILSITDISEEQKKEFARNFGLDIDTKVQDVKDAVFEATAKYQDDMIYVLDSVIENGEVKVKAKEIGKLVANDFLRVQVDSDKYKFRVKSTSQGVILFYSMTDEDLRYAIHVYPQIKDYEVDFGKKVTGEMIFTSVTMPEDKASVIREEGL